MISSDKFRQESREAAQQDYIEIMTHEFIRQLKRYGAVEVINQPPRELSITPAAGPYARRP